MKNKHYSTNYFDYQKRIGIVGGKINVGKFLEYIEPTDKVLDFGCGGGYLLENLNCKVKIGVEINSIARIEARKNRLVKIYSSTRLIKSNSVDKIISNHALEHTKNPIDELKALRYVLKRGGKIILVTPTEDS